MDELKKLAKELALMPDIHHAPNAPTAYGAANIDDLLDDLDLEAATDEILEEPVIEELTDDDLAEIEMKIEVQESYAQQNAVVADPSAEPPVSTKKSRTKSASSGVKKASTPRIERDLTKIAPEFFVLEGSTSDADDAVREAVIKLKPTQKKIAEKFESLFIALAAGRKPSTFIVDGLALLDKDRQISNQSLVAAFTLDEYDIGTARSQAGQIMKLFEVLRIGNPSADGSLAINPASTIADRIRNIVAGVAA